ncbi:hypothetical protein QYE76_055684 [Lolium multiflorum]|uniref:Uncharacterized protein n=1 Tax=Lolium multiflorum TaxID=4521 RepID=A0AAD8WPP6_LOLMU|nr:hypothetical protein QYE76_055684 [Lolium multiflorum]
MGKKKSAWPPRALEIRHGRLRHLDSLREQRTLGFISASEEDIHLPDKLVAKPKKSWQNALSPEERVIDDKLFDQVVALKNTGGLTMWGTEVVSVFLQRRVQPLMSRPHQLWLYTRKDDRARVSSADLSAEDLRDEVRRLTCLSAKDNIVLVSARPPYDSQHLPTKVPAVAQCYPPILESGVEPEDDNDNSEETEDAQHTLEDAISDDDDEVPLAKRAKLTLGRKASAQEPKLSPAKSTPPSRTTVEKIPLSRVIPAGSAPASSAARDHLIYATVDAVEDFAEQFTRLEAENAQLRKTVKSSADQVLEANRLATDAKKENALLKEEVSKLKQQMNDEQDARRAAAVAIDKKEGVLRESIKDLLEPANIIVTRRHQLREDSTSDALSLAAESNVQVLGLLQKTRGALSRLYSMIFPKVKQDKTLGEMAHSFLVDPSEPVEVARLATAGTWLEDLRDDARGNTFAHARWDNLLQHHVNTDIEIARGADPTRSHGVRFKGFTPQGVLEGLDLSLPSEERTRALRQEINYVVAHSLHRHSESLVNALERVALQVVQEIMRHQYSPSGPALGTHQGEVQLHTRPPLPYAMAAP